MKVFVAGAVYGKVEDFYQKVEDLKADVGQPEWILQTGDFGIWPNKDRIDRATRLHENGIDFPDYVAGRKKISVPTVFVAGKHEDHKWLNYKASYGGMEVVERLHYLLNGYQTVIGNNIEQLTLVGLGKAFSPAVYNHTKALKYAKKLSHYTRADVTLAQSHQSADILLTHEACPNISVGTHKSEAQGLDLVVKKLLPTVHLHGHYDHSDFYFNPYTGTPTYSLAIGEVRALEFSQGKFKQLA